MRKPKRLWRSIALAILIPGLALWLYTWSLWFNYAYLPNKRIPAEGRIYPRGIHGITVFQTLQERNKLDVLFRISIPTLAIGFVLAALEEERWRRRHPKVGIPKKWR
jgi:hypothetical protein